MKTPKLAAQVAAVKTEHGPMSSFVPDLKDMITTAGINQEQLITKIAHRAWSALNGSLHESRIYNVEERSCFYRVKGAQFVKVTVSPDKKYIRITNGVDEIRRSVAKMTPTHEAMKQVVDTHAQEESHS